MGLGKGIGHLRKDRFRHPDFAGSTHPREQGTGGTVIRVAGIQKRLHKHRIEKEPLVAQPSDP